MRAVVVLVASWLALWPSVAMAEFDRHGDRVLELFLAGRWPDLPALIGQDPDLTDGGRAFQLGLAEALAGRYAEAGAHLDQALASDDPPDPVDAEFLRGFRSGWGTLMNVAEATQALERLAPLEPTLPPDRASIFRAMRAFHAFLTDDWTTFGPAFAAWRAAYEPDRPKTVWDIAAGLMIAEIAYARLSRDEADLLVADLDRDFAARPDLTFVRDFVDFLGYLNGTDALEAEADLIALGTLLPRIEAAVSPYHTGVAASELSYALALWSQGRREEGLAVLAAAHATYAANPYARADSLAYIRAVIAFQLEELGEGAAAVPFSEASVAALEPSMRPSMISGILFYRAAFLWPRGGAEAVEALLAPWIDDAAFLARLDPRSRYDLLSNYAIKLAVGGDAVTARAVLAAAEAALDDDPVAHRAAELEVNAAYSRAVLESWLGDFGAAYRAATVATGAYRRLRVEVARGRAEGTPIALELDRFYAFAQAELGWSYLQGLP